MNRHLRKLPESFDRENPEQDRAADEGPAVVDPDRTTEDPKREPGG
jgi:hypothetical protein